MEYVFTKEEYEKLKKIVQSTEKRLETITNAKSESGAGQDGWHDESFRIFLVEEQMWNGRLNELKQILSKARIFEPKEQQERIQLGNGVEIKYEDTGEIFKFILDGYLIDLLDDNRVSIHSPLGATLLGAEEGERRTVRIGDQEKNVIVLKIVFPSKAKEMVRAEEE